MSSSLLKVLQEIENAREVSGNYHLAITEYERILGRLDQLIGTCERKYRDRLMDLKAKLQTELSLLLDLSSELSTLKSTVRNGPSKVENNYEEDRDPDVWPPPTPPNPTAAGGGPGEERAPSLTPFGRQPQLSSQQQPSNNRNGSNDNLPSWARARDSDVQRNNQMKRRPSFPGPTMDDPSSALSRAERLKKERDSLGGGPSAAANARADNALANRRKPNLPVQSPNVVPGSRRSFGGHGAAAGGAANAPTPAGRGGGGGVAGRGGGKKEEAPANPLSEYENQIMSEMLDKSPGVKWEDIAGLAYAKQTLQEAVILPNLRPDLFTGLRRPPKGVLLFGPPGTGKTLLAKAVATESGFVFFSITSSSVMSKYLGEGEKLMKALFQLARKEQPAVIFFDEIDALMSARKENEHEASRRMKTEFMTQVDGATTSTEDRILIMAATNIPWELDEAVLRRLVKRIYVPLPDEEARSGLIKHLMRKQGSGGGALVEDEEKLQRVVIMTAGYSGSDLSAVCHEAAMGPIRELGPAALLKVKAEEVRALTEKDFAYAVQSIRPSVSPDSLTHYAEWAGQFGVNR